MPAKTYTEQFRRDAVALYENTPGATYNQIAADLGINRNTLKNWVSALGTGSKTSKDGTTVTKPEKDDPAGEVTTAERLRQLEVENAKLREERDILRRAAKYFAEETNW